MVREIIQTLVKLTKIGNSKGVVIDKKIIEFLGLEIGDFLQLTVEKIEKKDFRKKESNKKEE
jgi:antitoxin component of MazEF toxin-antitoxin module